MLSSGTSPHQIIAGTTNVLQRLLRGPKNVAAIRIKFIYVLLASTLSSARYNDY